MIGRELEELSARGCSLDMIIKSLKGRIPKEFRSSTVINNNLLISLVSLSLSGFLDETKLN